MRTEKVVATAMFSALIFVVTAYLHVNVGVGYINFGDAFMFLAVCLMGGVWGAFAGAIGGALADLASGFAVYAPYTLVIKALEGLICGAIIYSLCKKHPKKIEKIQDNSNIDSIKPKNDLIKVLFSFVVGALFMVAGYYCANVIISQSWIYATGGLVTDLIQAGVSVVAGLCLTALLIDIRYVREIFGVSLVFKKHKGKNDEKK